MRTLFRYQMLLLTFVLFFPFSAFGKKVATSPQAQEFIVKKKKVRKSGKKSKEKACRSFVGCVTAGASVVSDIGQIQKFGLEKTSAYLEGDDPFSGLTKTQVQELTAKSEQLEKELCQLQQRCDEYIKSVKGMFS